MITREDQRKYNDLCYGCNKILREPNSGFSLFKEVVYVVKKFDINQLSSMCFIKFCEPCWNNICGEMYSLESEEYGEIEKI